MGLGGRYFNEVWLVDFEFRAPTGFQPTPVCVVAMELATGHVIRLWHDELNKLKVPPYSISKDSLLVAYYASAEIGCHLALGWSVPEHILDLFTEFRNMTNGVNPPLGSGLLGAATWFGMDALPAAEKHAMQELANRGGPWSDSERQALLDYCQSDVMTLKGLLNRILPTLDIDRALVRGEVHGSRSENRI
jgi:hypothetical protein